MLLRDIWLSVFYKGPADSISYLIQQLHKIISNSSLCFYLLAYTYYYSYTYTYIYILLITSFINSWSKTVTCITQFFNIKKYIIYNQIYTYYLKSFSLSHGCGRHGEFGTQHPFCLHLRNLIVQQRLEK